MAAAIRTLVWSERTEPAAIYPDGIDGAIATGLREAGIDATTAQLAQPDQGLGEEALSATDVLLWWSHLRHKQVTDETVDRVVRHIRERGMGFIPLHSSLNCRPLTALLGREPSIAGWREDDCPEHLYTIEPDHPIARGLPQRIVIPKEEMYSERFDIPAPEELVFLATFAQGEVFRAGCCWTRGNGRVFYFQPGHETNRVYDQPEIRHILANATRWAAHRD